MWSSRLFWKLFSAYAGLLLTSTAVLAALISARQKAQVLHGLEDRLRDDAVMMRSHVTEALVNGRNEGVQELTSLLAHETKTRITIVTSDGTVVADSDRDPAQMENHRDRTEIALAAESGLGVWSHVSRTLGIPMMYLAVRVDNGSQPVGFVRVALPLASVEEQVAGVQRIIWALASVVALVTLGVTYWVVARIIRPLAMLRGAAQKIAAGEYGHSVRVTVRDELGEVGEAFNRMSKELAQRVSQIREDRELLVTVLGSMIEGVVALDSSQGVLFANGAACSMLGLNNASTSGRPLWELVRHHVVQQAVQDCFASDRLCRSEFETTGTSRRVVALHGIRLPGDPPGGAVLVFHDVTELRRLENLRKEFVANVSHELKTPLSSIKGYAETLLSGAIDDRENNVAFVRGIAEQAERLHTLILDLLSLARIESGQEAFEIEPVSVATLVDSCLTQYATPAATKNITLDTQPPDTPVHVLADEEGARQILNNLVDNALKYTSAGGRVTVRWKVEGSAGLIQVVDTGIGITPQDQARIFERFYRVDKARSRELGGTGLGLSIVKHLTQAFGGSVAVASELDRGSTFSVRLPLA